MKSVSQNFSSAALPLAQSNVESSIIDVSQAFAADDAVTLARNPPATFNSMASFLSAEPPQETKAGIKRNRQKAVGRKEAFHAGEQSAKAPRAFFPSKTCHISRCIHFRRQFVGNISG